MTTKHPWDDLTDDELQEKAEFCREHFIIIEEASVNEVIKRVNSPIPISRWDWKKGDWFATRTGPYAGGKFIYTVHLVRETPRMTYPPPGAIPLPLAHQWLSFFDKEVILARSFLSGEPVWRCLSYETCIHHTNPHYTAYLGYRKVMDG